MENIRSQITEKFLTMDDDIYYYVYYGNGRTLNDLNRLSVNISNHYHTSTLNRRLTLTESAALLRGAELNIRHSMDRVNN